MKIALRKEKVREIYNKTAHYYNIFHNWGTFGLDEKGRNILVDRIINTDDYILDAGGGTGLTAIRAARRAGKNGKVFILDMSENMLAQARKKINAMGIEARFGLTVGDMYSIPCPDETFDAVLSTYSTCPLENPVNAVREMLRVLKPNGHLGIAHSTEAENGMARWISDQIEKLIWLFPRLSLGCRNIDLIDDLRHLDVEIVEEQTIGFIPIYFKILIVKKSGRN